jgi:hypothetical protein
MICFVVLLVPSLWTGWTASVVVRSVVNDYARVMKVGN